MRLSLEAVLSGDRRAISKAVTMVENDTPGAREMMRQLYPHTGRASIVGVTGPPGVGKSTLVHALVSQARQHQMDVGVIAVDPSSPFSGGALLGDRIRMQTHSLDPKVFVRSLASRGRLGGLSDSAMSVTQVLDAAGKDLVLIETVGTGQSEVEIMRLAHSVVVVLAPGLGDDIQALKSGILEIADVFAVNKADLGQSDGLTRQLEYAVQLRDDKSRKPAVIAVSAKDGAGIDRLFEEVCRTLENLKQSDELMKRGLALARSAILQKATGILSAFFENAEDVEDMKRLSKQVALRKLDPESAAKTLIKRYQDESKG